MATLHSSRAGESEDRLPLLSNEDGAFDEIAADIQIEFHGGKGPRSVLDDDAAERAALRDGSLSAGNAAPPRKRKKHYSGSEMIVAVFVVAFDTKKGNIVEWKYPSEVVLEEVEFKSMASGLHHIQKDFIYFKQNQLYGLSCFEKIPVANQEERGARMKSVGLLAVGYSDLHLHMDFLQRQVRIQVETPGEYGSLEEYFRHYRSPQQQLPTSLKTASDPGLLGPNDLPPLTITHPTGCFTKFLEYFGPKIFILWKLALLKKRVILFSPPPIGGVCHKVYSICLLSSHILPMDIDTEVHPQFYVNVADIDHLQSLDSYVACTTEKIFESKTQLYDVFVDQRNLTTSQTSLEPLLRVSPADEQRYERLNNIRSSRMISVGGAGSKRDDNLGFAEFFQELNSQLLRTVWDAASSEDHVLTIEMIDSIGLHPVKDKFFLTELAKTYDLDFTVQRPTDMFSCCL